MPVVAAILGAKDTVMVLAPHDFGMRSAAREAMNVLRDRQALLFRRHVFVVHAFVDDTPRGAAIGARPDTRGRDANTDVVGITRVDQHRTDAWLLAAGDALPLPAFGPQPQRLPPQPGLAAIDRAEEPARHRRRPHPPGKTTRPDYPALTARPGIPLAAGI